MAANLYLHLNKPVIVEGFQMFLARYLRRHASLFPLLLVLLCAPLAHAQGSAVAAPELAPAEVERIIREFTAKEVLFRKALNEYAFKRDALLQSIGMGGQVTGEYHRVSQFTFDNQGTRFERISFFPMPSFQGVTQEDLEDLGGVGPFALEPSKIDRYHIRYVGKEKIDELSLFVFDVTPKVIPNPKKTKERLFSGRIWVDDQDLHIVKSKGKGLPETKINKFPVVETYREQIDGRWWFPTYSYADEELVFDSGDVLHIRMKIKYTDFEIARARVRILEVDEPEKKPATPPKP
ncbi:MAG TPA: hypothetical protein VJU84_21070 [Pyrinomonadaceae bacterium]|nr:hypothetical protein [Pyrinomonadaceae bacterium]